MMLSDEENRRCMLLAVENQDFKEKIIKKTLPKTGFRELIENNNKKWEDKIKAKIEEIENEDKKYKNYLKDGRENFTPEYVWARPVLQSLLEKE